MDNKSSKIEAKISAPASNSYETNSEETNKNVGKEDVTIAPLSGPEIVLDEPSERLNNVGPANPNDLKSLLRKNSTDQSETTPGVYQVHPTNKTVEPNATNSGDIEEAVVVPVIRFEKDQSKLDSSFSDPQGIVMTEATKVEDSFFAEAKKIDLEKEKIEREKEVQDIIRKERENIFKNASAKNKRLAIFLVVIILAAVGCIIGIVVGNQNTSSSPEETKTDFPPVVDLRGDNVKVQTIVDEGRSFHVPVADFMIPFDNMSPDGNGNIKSTLRVFNSRTNTTKAIVVEKKDGIVHGWYNPTSSSQPGDFQVGDILSAIDYNVFSEQTCNRVPFVVKFSTSSALKEDANDIKIGREGVVGARDVKEPQDFDVLAEVAGPVSKFWTDAVDAYIEILQEGSWANWPKKILSDSNTSSIRPFQGPLSGIIRVCFKNIGADVLKDLVSESNGGGLHIAFCT